MEWRSADGRTARRCHRSADRRAVFEKGLWWSSVSSHFHSRWMVNNVRSSSPVGRTDGPRMEGATQNAGRTEVSIGESRVVKFGV